ncbi:glycoside hydrolase superfamily [Dichotomocladium elegans]|nr:glycoside hydrolase superfamily [Dichotomocladium elegans]
MVPSRLFSFALQAIVLVIVLLSGSSSAAPRTDKGVIAYVSDWALPSKIPWTKLDHVIYAFGEPGKNGQLTGFDSAQLKSVVKEGHAHNKKVSLSIGGWTGSRHFSTLVRTSSTRNTFAKIIVNTVKKYDLDGINLDWEYPNSPNGVACNSINSKDTANLLKFAQTLRRSLPSSVLLTAAVSTSPFNGPNKEPLSYLGSSWAKAIDAFYIMGYDMNGSWNTQAGPNAPLYSNPAAKGTDPVSASSAIKAWKAAGIPSKQLVLGVPFYGHVGRTKTPITKDTGLYVKLAGGQIKGDKYDEKSKDPCANAVASYSGMYQWRSIVANGIIKNKSGWKTYQDKKSQTPYAAKSTTFLSYDDPASLKKKVAYAKRQGLSGVMIWSLEMDDSKHSLLNALQGMRH